MKQGRHIIGYTVVFTGLLFALYLMMALFATLPNAAIQNNMRSSAKYFINADSYAFSEDGLFRNITDNYADQIWTNIGWHMGYGNPFVSVLDTKYYDSDQHDTAVGLHLAVTREQEANVKYSRYWHGTAGLIRFLHLFTNIRGIKWIGMLCLLLLIGKTLLVLCRSGYWDLSLCLLVSLFGIQIGNLRLSAEYLPSFLVCFGLCPAFLRAEKKGDFHLNTVAIVSGTLTAFFDFLTTETVAILIPLILIVAVRSKERRLGSPRQVLRMLLGCGFCWLAAYVGTFSVKWIAVSVITGENHILAALDSFGNRVNGVITVEETMRHAGPLMAIGANFSVLFEGNGLTEFRQATAHLTAFVLAGFLIYRLYRVRKKRHPGTGFLLFLGGIVFLRFGILANHSYMHAFFTYRALASTILAMLSAMVINLQQNRGRLEY